MICYPGSGDSAMAVWQFDALLLPEETLKRRYGSIPIAIPSADIDASDWWQGTSPPADLAERLSSFLPQASTWSRNIQSWGQEDGDRIDVVWANEGVAEIFLRVDVRRISYALLDKVSRLARANRWVLWVDGHVLRPSPGQVLRAIHRSDAFRFVQDPETFLLALERTKERDPSEQ
jgi:hypothetical protein